MNVGELVRINPNSRWLSPEEYRATGIILQVLDGGSHRKNTSYQVMWSEEIPHTRDAGTNKTGWYVKFDLEVIS